MRRLGLDARSLSVSAMVLNRRARTLMEETSWKPTERQMLRCAKHGGYMVQIDLSDAPDGRFAGHIVAVVADTMLVDGAAGQFSRPRKKMAVPPVVDAPVSADFLAGETDLVQISIQGALMIYSARPDDRRHEGTPGFSASPHNVEAVEAILEDMR
jgi:hypothetical protein